MLTMLCGRSRALWPRVAREIEAALKDGAENILLITPAQYTLQAELDLVDGLRLPGLLRVQVMSPESLARQVFARAGAPEETPLGAAGRAMALERALAAAGAKFRYYQSAAGRRGFREQAATAVAALKQGRMTPAAVRETAETVRAEDEALAEKLRDVAALFEAYEEQLSGRFIDAEDMREALCARRAQSRSA